MTAPANLTRHFEFAVLQHHHVLMNLALVHLNMKNRQRRRERRPLWARPWIGRRMQYGLYDQLMVELRNEDHDSFTNFMRMPPHMFDELLARVGPRITKQRTFYREPLQPGLKLALTLRHLASGNTYSIVLMALVDAEHKFIWADMGGTGSASDAQIFNSCELKGCSENGTLGLPMPDPLPNDTENMPYFFVGDEAFALRPTMMKPYSRRGLTNDQRIFNYRISRARRVVENAFGILANRFQILLTTMQHDPSNVKLIVKTCLILHNLMRTRYPGLQNQQLDRTENENREFVPGAWREGRNLEDTQTGRGNNRASRDGKKQRNLLRHWVNTPAGAVSWQDKMI